MKTVILHGLGQTAKDWVEVIERISLTDIECPELFSKKNAEPVYPKILDELESRYMDLKEPLVLCGLSLGAMLAIDYTIRNNNKVSALILIGAQYKTPRILMGFQNAVFRIMPEKMFKEIGLSKDNLIKLTRSMRSLDFSSQLKEIECPVVIICGERDKTNIRASKELASLIAHAELRIIPNAGHEINRDAPGALADIINNTFATGS